jgi:hypothetical protein
MQSVDTPLRIPSSPLLITAHHLQLLRHTNTTILGELDTLIARQISLPLSLHCAQCNNPQDWRRYSCFTEDHFKELVLKDNDLNPDGVRPFSALCSQHCTLPSTLTSALASPFTSILVTALALLSPLMYLPLLFSPLFFSPLLCFLSRRCSHRCSYLCSHLCSHLCSIDLCSAHLCSSHLCHTR